MGVTATTPSRLLLGAGDLSVGSDVGATKEPSTFRVERTEYWPDLNGVKGDLKGTGFIIKEMAFLEVTMVEFTLVNIALALPSVDVLSDALSEVISGGEPGCIGTAHHNDVVWTGKDCDGDDVTITLKDAVATGNLEMSFSDEEETSFRVVFKATYDPANKDVRPWHIVVEVS